MLTRGRTPVTGRMACGTAMEPTGPPMGTRTSVNGKMISFMASGNTRMSLSLSLFLFFYSSILRFFFELIYFYF